MDAEIQFRRLKARIQTAFSPKIDLVDLAKILLKYWSPEDAIVMIAICGGESGYRMKAMNVDRKHGQEDHGLFQINEIHKPRMDKVYDPEYNVKRAYSIWKRQGFSAWVAYDHRFNTEGSTKSWLRFVKLGEEAVREALSAESSEEVPPS